MPALKERGKQMVGGDPKVIPILHHRILLAGVMVTR